MSYYRGDYYRGDGGNYYKGDPFLGAALGFVARKVAAPLVKKAGAWIGRQTVGGLAGKAAGTAIAAAATPGIIRSVSRQEPIIIDPSSAFPGGDPFLQLGSGRKKYRRMNPLNPRALKRALRRAEGFEKFARKTMSALYKPGSSRKYKKTTKRS